MNPVLEKKIHRLTAGKTVELEAMQGWPGGGYRLSGDHVGAIQAAFFAERPLLVRGDPGLGKSQLAQAIASYLGWGLVSAVIHYNTDIDGLLYSQDHLERLYQANRGEQGGDLSPECYVRPGKIWQAMAPDTVTDFKGTKPHEKEGTVLLIDEIDKADSTLPNALLEVLDNRAISIPYRPEPIQHGNHPLFVVITSNDERDLPHAFLRRCAVLELHLASDKHQAIEQLKDIYQTHLKYDSKLDIGDDLVNQVAADIFTQRKEQTTGEYLPGTSEFLDVIKALSAFPDKDRQHNLDELVRHLVNKSQQRV